MGAAPVGKQSFHDTLSPRGVCSRIPHLRPFRRDSHGLFLAHVYAHIIPCLEIQWGQTPWQRHVSHNAPRPLQQPQMPDMKQVKSSVCNHIRHFSLLSYLPSAGNPSTQPPIRRLALPLIRSIIQPNGHASLNQPTSQSPSFHRAFPSLR